ncbi:MAG: prepilin-type N-terminal cleavage/methylation domain-containing protein [Myxococcota bacterium]
MKPRRRRRARRGMGLLEVMMATVLLAIGMVATFAMLDRMEGVHRSLDLTQTANDTYSQLAAQIRDAQCDYDGTQAVGVLDPATTDTGIFNAIGAGWIGFTQPIPANSSITHAGVTDGSMPALPRTVPPVRIEYRLEREAAPVLAAGAINAPPGGVGPALDVEIRVRLLTNDPVRDDPALDQGWWIKHFPLKKTCNARYERTRRGEYL